MIKNLITNFLNKIVFFTFFYYGVLLKVTGIMNILTFLLLLSFMISIIGGIIILDENSLIKNYKNLKGKVFNTQIEAVIAVAYTLAFAYYGHIGLAFVYIITFILFKIPYEMGKSLYKGAN